MNMWNGQRTFIEGLDVERRITEMGLNLIVQTSSPLD